MCVKGHQKFHCGVFTRPNCCDLPYLLRSFIAINNCVAFRDDGKEVLLEI